MKVKIILSIFVFILLLPICSYNLFAEESANQEWDDYPNSPVLTSLYPYQFIDADQNKLFVSNKRPYAVSATSIYDNDDGNGDDKQYNLVDNQWVYNATWSSVTNVDMIIQTNFDITTVDDGSGTVIFEKTTNQTILTSIEALTFTDYILIIPDATRDFDSWNVKISVKQTTPLGDYFEYLDQYVFLGKNAFRFDKTSPSWRGRDKLYKFEITYINNDIEVSNQIIEKDVDYPTTGVSTGFVPQFTVRNNNGVIQLKSNLDYTYSIVFNQTWVGSHLSSVQLVPVNLADFSQYFFKNQWYNISTHELEEWAYYELYILSSDKSVLYGQYNFSKEQIGINEDFTFDIYQPLLNDVTQEVNKTFNESYADVTPDAVLDTNGFQLNTIDSALAQLKGTGTLVKNGLGGLAYLITIVSTLLATSTLFQIWFSMASAIVVTLGIVAIVKIIRG